MEHRLVCSRCPALLGPARSDEALRHLEERHGWTRRDGKPLCLRCRVRRGYGPLVFESRRARVN